MMVNGDSDDADDDDDDDDDDDGDGDYQLKHFEQVGRKLRLEKEREKEIISQKTDQVRRWSSSLSTYVPITVNSKTIIIPDKNMIIILDNKMIIKLDNNMMIIDYHTAHEHQPRSSTSTAS